MPSTTTSHPGCPVSATSGSVRPCAAPASPIAADAETRRYRRARADRHVTSRPRRRHRPAHRGPAARGPRRRPRAPSTPQPRPPAPTATPAPPARSAPTPSPPGSPALDRGRRRPAVQGQPRHRGRVAVRRRHRARPRPGRRVPARRAVHRPRPPRRAAAKATLRRLFATPDDRALVAMESTSRRFDGLLAEFLDLRDGGICRTPGCNATIRHHDHVTRAADGGPTTARQRPRTLRALQLRQGDPRLDLLGRRPGRRPALHEVHGVTEHLRITRSTSPPLPGGPAGPSTTHPPSSGSPATTPWPRSPDHGCGSPVRATTSCGRDGWATASGCRASATRNLPSRRG